jgi:hypothetical protein
MEMVLIAAKFWYTKHSVITTDAKTYHRHR